MSTWHSPIVDYLRLRVPSDSRFRPYAKQVVEDGRSLLRLWRSWEHFETEAPATLHVEPTNICNANCVFCAYQFQDRMRSGRGMMTLDMFARALRDYRALGGTRVDLTPLVGEPLLDPGLTEKIRLAKTEGFNVGFCTNGIRLNRIDLVDFATSEIDHLRISTSPFDRTTFERLYRSHGYDDLRDGVHRFLVTRNELGSNTRVSILFRSDVSLAAIREHPDFQTAIEPHLREAERSALYAQERSFDNWSGQIAADDLPPGMALAKPPRIRWRPCRWTYAPMVLYDGSVRACGSRFGPDQASRTGRSKNTDDLEIGHLDDDGLPAIWRGERLRRIRRSFVDGSPPATCQTCTMYRPV